MEKRVRAASVAAACLFFGVLLWCFLKSKLSPGDGVQMKFVGRVADRTTTVLSNAPFVGDDLFLKFDPRSRRAFHVTATRDTSIFVWESGVEILTSAGWKPMQKEYRGNIWRLTNGVPYEVCVELPESTEWRAYIHYAPELRGMDRLKRQVQVAWRSQSFSNWTGKAWGGGFFGGSNYLTGETIGPE